MAANTKEYILGYLPNNFEILLDTEPAESILIAISIGILQGPSYKVDTANPIT
jgi:hypothetical protein